MSRSHYVIACLLGPCLWLLPLQLSAYESSFTVSGPVYLYFDHLSAQMICNNTTSCGYTYSMTVTYDSAGTGTSEPYLLWNSPGFPYLHTFFIGNILSIDSVLYNASHEEVLRLSVENPDYNQTDIYEDQGANYWDFLHWTLNRGYATGYYNHNGVTFYMPVGGVEKESNGYPIPPYDGSYRFPSGVSSVAYDFDKRLFYYYYGYIGEISTEDSIVQCRANSQNHGQFMKCANELTNAWKKAGKISGAEKGALTSEFAHDR